MLSRFFLATYLAKMCGIAGIFNLNGQPASSDHLRRMTDSIAHRGPDAEGWFVDGSLGFGHRRLSIIDLSEAASQPMSADGGRYCITYNGELYNFREIRKELESLGRTFVSHSDTEVILRAFIEWGPECLNRFNGMFAFAIWYNTNRELILARDRYGVKPLYYRFDGKSLVFASECKAILSLPGADCRLDHEAMVEYFTFQNFFTDRTLVKGIRMFPAGCWARITPDSASLDPVQYWDFDFTEPEKPAGEEEYLEELDRLFRNAVKRQLVSDVELGSYLSGGMDSGSITAVAASHLPYIKTFTCGFDLHSASGLELAFDEREKAEMMSYLFRTEHYEMVLKAGDMERALPQLAWHLEEPRVGQSYPNYYVARLASKFVKVALGGTGGDELFGGYPWRYYHVAANDDFEQYIDKYYNYWQRLIPINEMKRVFAPVWEHADRVSTREIFKSVFRKHAEKLTRPEDYINHSLYFEAKTFLHGLLVVEDKLSMAHSLESRVPFLDNELVDFATRVPLRLKLRNLAHSLRLNENEPGLKSDKYFGATRDGKLLLRKVMERYVPRETTEAVKQGFSAPDASWFRGESIDYVRRIIYNDKSRMYDSLLDRSAVCDLVTEHLNGKTNRRLFIWSLLNFEWFLEKFIHN